MNSSPSDVCQQCGETVEIFNGDINFSLELHQQSHKTLETIAQDIDDQLTTTELQLETSKPQMIGPVQSASRGYCDVFLECEEKVKVLDGDDILSVESHQQSYKTEGTILQDIDKHLSTMQAPKMQHPNYTCPDCKEIIEIHNNDVVFSFKIHSEKHKTQYLGTYPNDQQSNLSDTSRKSNTKVKKKKKPQQSNVLDTLFTTMPPGLQSHRDFILENEIGKAVCTICKVNIEPKLSISAHLKTKAHEDNTISLLKNTLPTNLHDMLEFVSFYGSNLYCNLCGCKVDLCSSNIFETIVNIIVHNFSKDHLKKKTDSTTQTDAGLILKSLALVNPLINENKHMISHKLLPQFKCNVCEKNIGYHENETELTKNFVAHLNSVDHNKCVSNKFILDSFKALYPSEKDHNFIVMKNNIFCTICSCTIDDANLVKLILHLKQASLNSPLDSVSKPNQLCIPSTSMFVPAAPPTAKGSSIILEGVPVMQSFPVESTPQKEINLKELLNTLPEQFKTISCIILNDQGKVTCTICKCTIPAYTYNLQTHLLGNRHKNNDKPQGASNVHPILSQPTKIECVKLDKNNGNKLLDIKELFSLLPSSMQMNIDFVKTCNNNVHQVFCTVCNANISASSKTLQEHFSGSQHTSLLKSTLPIEKTPVHITKNVSPKDEDNLLNNIMETDRFIKSFAKFLDKKDLHYMCTLCKSTITRSSDEQIFKENLMSHATGKKHKTTLLTILYEKLELSNPNLANYSTDIKVNGADFYCRLCGCLFPSLTEEKVLIQNITTHLNGKKHLKEKKKLLIPNSAPVSIDMSSSIKFKDTITECFKKLPITFQDDIQHIKSGPIEGYFSCKLCESTINPCFLKSHLEDGNHVQRKTNSGESFDLITF